VVVGKAFHLVATGYLPGVAAPVDVLGYFYYLQELPEIELAVS
jgi:hypothetical protein